MIFAVMIASTLALPGCLTIRRGSTQIVPVDSNPHGARVRVEPNGQTFTTPQEVVLARRYTQTLTFEKEGFESKTVVIERKASSGLWPNGVWIHPAG
jgi:hypothetical protein